MRIGPLAILTACAAIAIACAADLREDMASLDHERDPARLEAAATAIAASTDSTALADLGTHLGHRSFLLRLDPPNGSVPVIRVGRVFRVLAEHPSSASSSLCTSLAGNTDFTEVPARMNFLLAALAAVRPMSEAAANIFRTTNRSGYLEVNGPLLARNSSPRALEVFGELMADSSIDAAQRISIAHWGLLPNRTNADLVATCARILKTGLPKEVEAGIVESLYDYQPRLWFGVASGQPSPPSWNSAPEAARRMLRSLATKVLSEPDLAPRLRAAVRSTLKQL